MNSSIQWRADLATGRLASHLTDSASQYTHDTWAVRLLAASALSLQIQHQIKEFPRIHLKQLRNLDEFLDQDSSAILLDRMHEICHFLESIRQLALRDSFPLSNCSNRVDHRAVTRRIFPHSLDPCFYAGVTKYP